MRRAPFTPEDHTGSRADPLCTNRSSARWGVELISGAAHVEQSDGVSLTAAACSRASGPGVEVTAVVSVSSGVQLS
jgi:hypothetical protein